jgi:hypothetical protein
MEEKINVKMLQLTIENKEMKQKLVDFLELTKGMHGVKAKWRKMDWNRPCI